MQIDKKALQKAEKKTPSRVVKGDRVGYGEKSALLEDAIAQMNAGKYGKAVVAVKELLALDSHNTEARRLFATLHLRLGSLVTARQAFESLATEAIGRQDFWLAESLLREYLAAGPRCVPFLELLAHVYEGKGDTMGAVAELGKAIDILIEDPIPENLQKPAELYAKVRALEPASPVALQFASLFDIQTGELLAPHPMALSSAPSVEDTMLPPSGDTVALTEADIADAGIAIPSDIGSPAPLLREQAEDFSIRVAEAAPPAPPASEPVELAGEMESVSLPSFAMQQPEETSSATSVVEPPIFTMAPDSPSEPDPVCAAEPDDSPVPTQAEADAPSQWSTGEVAVQTHRPSLKKQNWDKEKGEGAVIPPTPLPLVDESSESVAERSRSGGWESAPSETVVPVAEVVAPVVEEVAPPVDPRPEWDQASDSITFVTVSQQPQAAELTPAIESFHTNQEPASLTAAPAVEVLVDSTVEHSQVRAQDLDLMVQPSLLPLVVTRHIGLPSLLGHCASRTQALALLCAGFVVSCVALVAIGIGLVGLVWLVMEEPPTQGYQSLMASAPQVHIDPARNGYFLLLGFEAFPERDPMQVGQERRTEEPDRQAAQACMAGDERNGGTAAGASAAAVRGWLAAADPAAQLKGKAETVRSWATQESLALKRYQRWLSMPFEDAGYGQLASPNCGHILLAHRLYLAEGFTQDLSVGLDRLETDMGAWRMALGQSKTLMVKMLAATAIQEDVAVASGLLLRQDLDWTSIGRLGKIVRPLDQAELSLRWPMQSHFLWATTDATSSLKHDKTNERPLYASLAATMPLPVQRRSNAYADYYETAGKAVAEHRYTNLPKLSGFVRTPAAGILDYLANPVEHLIGIEPLPSWDPYVGRMVETDVRLRLASLQAWIRRGTQEGNVLTRLAQAGQDYHDPFTGLPMLVNQQRGVMYSVGPDGQDQDGDSKRDIVATIPGSQSFMSESPRALFP